jgi:hypothetical protein
VLGHGGQHRHQVRLAGAIVADDQQAAIVSWLSKLHLGDDQPRQQISHTVRDDVGLDQLVGFFFIVCRTQLDDGFDRLKLDQVFVLHGSSSLLRH